MRKERNLLESLIDSDVKIGLLNFFRKTPEGSQYKLEELAKTLMRKKEEIEGALSDFLELGLIKATELFSFDHERYERLQQQMSRDMGIKVDRMLRKGITGVTGVKVLDNLLPEGYPSGSTILISGDTGAGGEILAQQMLGEALKMGRTGYYVTFNRFPEDVRSSLRLMGYNLEDLESRGSPLYFADFYSGEIGLKSHERYSEVDLSLTQLGVILSEILEESKDPFFVFDSLTTLIHRHRVSPAQAFLRTLVAKTKAYKANSILLLNRQAFQQPVIATMSDIMDGVIEMKTEEKSGSICYALRVSKMRRILHKTLWAQYTPDPEGGIKKG